MARVAWPAPFPLGVADAGATLALCKALDELVVLRLADGEVVWHARVDAQPLLVGDGLAIALCAGEVLAYSIVDADTGTLRWRVSLPATPTETQAAWIDGDVAVQWRSHERYRGGAHPGSRAVRNMQQGQCFIHPASGSALPLTAWPQRADTPAWEASDDPLVLSACVIGATRYRAKTTPGGGLAELKIIASRANDDSVVWERSLGNFAPRPAPRLRP